MSEKNITPPRPMTDAERLHHDAVAQASVAALCAIEMESQFYGDAFWKAVVRLARNDALLASVLERAHYDAKVPDATKQGPLLASIPPPRMPQDRV